MAQKDQLMGPQQKAALNKNSFDAFFYILRQLRSH